MASRTDETGNTRPRLAWLTARPYRAGSPIVLILALVGLAVIRAAPQEPGLELALAPAADYSPVYPTSIFPAEAPEIAAIFHLAPDEAFQKLTARWIAVETGGAAPPEHVVLTREQTLSGERVGAFLFRTNAAPPGRHRIDVLADGKPWRTAEFEIVASAEAPPGGPPDGAARDLFPLAAGTTWTYTLVQEPGQGARLDPPAGVELDAEGRFQATVFIVVSDVDSAGAHVQWRRGAELMEEEWLRLSPEGLVRTQRAQGGERIPLEPPELLLPAPHRLPPDGAWDAPAYEYELRYRGWGPLPVRGPDGTAPGYVTLAVYPPPFETTVERHYQPGVGLVREVLIAARGGRRLERRELTLLAPVLDLTPEPPAELRGADTSGHLAVFLEQKPPGAEGTAAAMEFVSITNAGDARLSTGFQGLQLSADEVQRLRALFEEVGFDGFQERYGREVEGGGGSRTTIFYYGSGAEKTVSWHDPPSEPAPPAGWSRLVAELAGIRERLRAAQ